MAKLSDEQRRALYGLSPHSEEEARLLQHVLKDEPATDRPARATMSVDEVDAQMRARAQARMRRHGLKRPIWINEEGTPQVPSIEEMRAALPSGSQFVGIVITALVLAGILGWMAWLFLGALPW